MPVFSEADRRQILTTQQDKVKLALSQANEIAQTEGRQRRRLGGILLVLLLGFSCWRVARPRQRPARSQAILKFVKAGKIARRLPVPLKHILALRNLSELVEDEDSTLPLGSPARAATSATTLRSGSPPDGQQNSRADHHTVNSATAGQSRHNASLVCASTTGCTASGSGS